ncbi:atp-binding protein of abc transporter [hydrocarbon metagenome]|uniref:Atp-binding protein of abc transporter n=1 Tax=hydrocarbon metagenome TaxID=938273 RepID=A0A0W8E6V7_9ZZZZ
MLLSCRKVKKSFGDSIVLNSVDLDIYRGDRIGLVGRNGAGKTTLANIITGYVDYDEGSITAYQMNIGYLKQTEAQIEVLFTTSNIDDQVQGEFHRQTSNLGMKRVRDWSSERLHNLSGGEKTKIALATIWASDPDLIILDEPTNHMDYQGVKHLESELARYQGTAIIISHDRYFLDRTVQKIAEIEKGVVRIYPGNYSSYREIKQQEHESQIHSYESQQKEQRKIEGAVSRLKNWSDKAHRESRQKGAGMKGGKEYYRKKAKKRDQSIKSQFKRLENMRQEGIDRPKEERPVKFIMSAMEKRGRRLLEAEGIAKAYDENRLFEDSSFYINRGEKVGILGPNGCGKTTLLKIILGQETLDAGEIFLSSGARVAYVNQELPQGETASLKTRVKEWNLNEQKQMFQLLISLGLDYNHFGIPLKELSRGERMKISMGFVIIGAYDLLIFDEPTNHLDLCSREALERSLLNFPGSILLISHDRYLLENVCDKTLVFDQKRIIRVEGTVSDYLNKKRIEDEFQTDPGRTDLEEEKLLLENRIARVLSELSLLKPGEPAYSVLDDEYRELIRRRNQISSRDLSGGRGY